MEKRYRPGIFAAVYKNEKGRISYLLLKRKLHWKGWEFPKGGIEKRESELQALKREVEEETGLNALKIKRHGVKGKFRYDKIIENNKHEYVGQTYSLYSVEVRPGRVRFDKKEHSEFKWKDYNRAIRILTWPNQRKCLRIVNKQVIL